MNIRKHWQNIPAALIEENHNLLTQFLGHLEHGNYIIANFGSEMLALIEQVPARLTKTGPTIETIDIDTPDFIMSLWGKNSRHLKCLFDPRTTPDIRFTLNYNPYDVEFSLEGKINTKFLRSEDGKKLANEIFKLKLRGMDISERSAFIPVETIDGWSEECISNRRHIGGEG